MLLEKNREALHFPTNVNPFSIMSCHMIGFAFILDDILSIPSIFEFCFGVADNLAIS